ncbi:hypothetical protein Acsp04_43280 [Actinomadura sp. NBRC 104425]|uniref:hypothetical protein n=1 Tax=Actinomadura sp. NBRC 104425 TaxID=3032204 RepID=UPI0024A20872|nr:hypothetical protein [Actinomadura sp. NBRC 104425]GLZ14093.1 hypothetical protein Acsp04_43280 [Actinomadura sp. NBRC 104425]
MKARQRGYALGATAAALLVTAPVAAADTITHDVVRVDGATVLKGGRDVAVKVTYSCTKGNTLSVAVAQTGDKLPRRVAAGKVPASCNGKLYSSPVTAKPIGTFVGWQRKTAASVGAVISMATDGTAQLRAKDSTSVFL